MNIIMFVSREMEDLWVYTDHTSTLWHWMVAGPEVSRLIEEFIDACHCWGRLEETSHHDQTASVQATFEKYVRSLITVIVELVTPLEEKDTDMLVFDTKDIADPAVVEPVSIAHTSPRNSKKLLGLTWLGHLHRRLKAGCSKQQRGKRG